MRKKPTKLLLVLLICSILLIPARNVYAEEDLSEAVETGEETGAAAEDLDSADNTDPEDQDEPDPEAKNGWYDEDGNLYYYVDDVLKTGWLELEDGTYFLNEEGGAVRNSWLEEEDNRFYFGDDCRMVSNAWAKDGSAWCYLQADGTAAKEQWIRWNDAWYYLKADCHMAANEWQKDSAAWCYLLSSGKAAKNQWISWNGGWYYLKGNCRMAESEWVKDSKGWCYLGKSGKAYANGWKWIGNTEYKFSSSCRMVGAWMKVPCVMQNPELPTGCESVALTNALKYYGFNLSKTTMAASYVARSTGTNFVTAFHGNPYSSTGGMVCAPGIVIAANKYLKEKKSTLRGHELTGASLWSLCQNHIANGRPVIIWTSIGYSMNGHVYRSQQYGGRTYYAHTLSHTVVLSGYDEEQNVVWISDSISGKVKKKYSLVNSVYVKHGKQAVVLY